MGILREMNLGINYKHQNITSMLSISVGGRDIGEYFCIVCCENRHDFARFISLHGIECTPCTAVTGSSDKWPLVVAGIREVIKKKKPLLVVVESVDQWSSSDSSVFEGGDLLVDIKGNIRSLSQL